MTFNEWRHATNYDNRMSGAITLEKKVAIMKEIALEAMKMAVARGDKLFAQQVMNWAHSKRLV